MRKVILLVAVSLDGYIEGTNGEYDWCFTDQDYGMTDFLAKIDAIFYGRKSYEVMLKAGNPEALPFASKKSYVFSNTLNSKGTDVEIISGDIVQQVKKLKAETGKDIWLFGGANLLTTFINEELLDEIELAVHPLLLGAGSPLFKSIRERVKLQLLEAKTYSTGLVYLRYEVDKENSQSGK